MNLRRSFVLASTILTLLGCSKKATSPEQEIHTKENKYGTYETYEINTDDDGRARITSELTNEVFDISSVDDKFNAIPNSDIHIYNDDKDNLFITSLINQDSDYLPGFYSSPEYNLEGRISGSDILYEAISLLKTVNSFRDIYIGFLDDAPSFDENHLLNIHGILYEGDWSFNEAKNVSNLLDKSFMILVPVIPRAKPISVATGIISTVADKMNDVIDFMNKSPYIEIDKDEKLEFYTIPGFNITFFLPKLPNDATRFVEDYIRDEQGDWWDYNYGLTMEVDGFKNLNGKNIPIFIDNQGTMAYQGFDDVFSKIFGNKIESGNQEFIYQPPAKFGDDRLSRNKNYRNTIKEINTGRYGNIDYSWIGIDGVTTPAGRFDNCWKVKEISGNNSITRWFAEGVGQVQIEYNGAIIKLEDYGSGGLSSVLTSTKDNMDFSYLILGSLSR